MRHRPCSDEFRVLFANVSSWTPAQDMQRDRTQVRAHAVEQFFLASQAHLAFAAETHMPHQQCEAVAQRLSARGWWTSAAAAQPSLRSPTGTHGGVLSLCRKHVCSAPLASDTLASNSPLVDLVGRVLYFKFAELLMLAAYFVDGIGLTGENMCRLQQVDRVTACGKTPFILSADFNMEPSELAQSGWLERVKAQIVVPANSTHTCVPSHGRPRVIDYLVVSSALIPFVSKLTVRTDVPWRPHYALSFAIRQSPWQVNVLQCPTPSPWTVKPTEQSAQQGITWAQALDAAPGRCAWAAAPGYLRPCAAA